MKEIDWTKQHCGVIQGSYYDVIRLMPDLFELLETFPDHPFNFTWDVKVHMLMPGQYPCIPNWHRDMVPRDENGTEVSEKMQLDKPMYLWLSNGPLTEFRKGGFIKPKEWYKFTQEDEHRGHPADKFVWRGLIRATHNDLKIRDNKVNNPFNNFNPLRRHCQVYLDADNFTW